MKAGGWRKLEGVLVSDFHFDLPEELIAQHPAKVRGASRMLVVDREQRAGLRDAWFRELPEFLRAGDLLVLNDSRVLPARLFATRVGLGTQAGSPRPSGMVEVLLVERQGTADREQGAGNREQRMVWKALVRPAKKVRAGERLEFYGADSVGVAPKQGLDLRRPASLPGTPAGGAPDLTAEVVGEGEFGERTLMFAPVEDFLGVVGRIGRMPLPPYIRRPGQKHVSGAKAPKDLGTGDAGTEIPAYLERGQDDVNRGQDGVNRGQDDGAGDYEAEDRERYQTVYGREVGSAAAPTAGLHFTEEMLGRLRERGVEIATVTLHVGLGTFQPVRVAEVEDIRLHAERYTLPAATADALNRAMAEGRRVVAVGTTTTRVLEHVAAQASVERVPGAKAPVSGEPVLPGLKSRPISEADAQGASEADAQGSPETDVEGAPEATRELRFCAHSGSTSIFIGPGHRFRVVGGLLTNFHLPQSTLLMLVSAFAQPVSREPGLEGPVETEPDAGRRRVLEAYAHAVREGYRFYSYGDCMLVV